MIWEHNLKGSKDPVISEAYSPPSPWSVSDLRVLLYVVYQIETCLIFRNYRRTLNLIHHLQTILLMKLKLHREVSIQHSYSNGDCWFGNPRRLTRSSVGGHCMTRLWRRQGHHVRTRRNWRMTTFRCQGWRLRKLSGRWGPIRQLNQAHG